MTYKPINAPKSSFHSIPTRFKLHGDNVMASALIGSGRDVLQKLSTSMSFQGISIGKSVVKFSDGSIIEASISHGISSVDIFVIKPKGSKNKYVYECFCSCGITSGTIISGPADIINKPTEWIPEFDSIYGVRWCQGDVFKDYDGEGKLKKQKSMDFFPHRSDEIYEGEPTRESDIVYGVIQESDVNGDHIDLMEVFPCSWISFRVLSISVDNHHLPKLSEVLDV